MAVYADIAATPTAPGDRAENVEGTLSPEDESGIEKTDKSSGKLSLRLRWVLLIAVGLLSLGGYYAVWRVSDVNRAPQAYGAFVALYVALFALYLLACYLVLSAGRALSLKPMLLLIGIVAALARALLVPAPPTLSNDIYRYVWDGRVMSAGISPFRYPPGAPQLVGLRSPEYDRALWQYINRKNAITIYPAGAELFYEGVYTLVPDSVVAMKIAMVAVDLASCAALVLLLALLGMPPARSIVYAWSPLPVMEFSSSGHVEALSVLWTLLALIAGVLAVRRYGAGGQRRFTLLSLLAAICLGAAILAKLIPLLLLAGWFRRFGWRVSLAAVAVFGVVSLIFIGAWGGYISPFLGTYLGSEESNAPFFYILKYGITTPLGLGDGPVRLLLGVSLAAFALFILLRREHGPYDFIGKSFLLVGAYLLLATSTYAWYATWLLLFVPLFLPPNGLLIFGSSVKPGQSSLPVRTARGKWWRAGHFSHGIAFAALAYTGLTFLGYLGFAWQVPILPWALVALQVCIVGLSGVLCVPFLNRST